MTGREVFQGRKTYWDTTTVGTGSLNQLSIAAMNYQRETTSREERGL